MAGVNIGGLPPHSRSLRIFKGELTVKQDLIKDVIQGMLPYLNNAQNEKFSGLEVDVGDIKLTGHQFWQKGISELL